jgi:hypothetical protein
MYTLSSCWSDNHKQLSIYSRKTAVPSPAMSLAIAKNTYVAQIGDLYAACKEPIGPTVGRISSPP